MVAAGLPSAVAGVPVSAMSSGSAAGSPDGAALWVSRYNGPVDGDDDAAALGVSPDGAMVFVTGPSYGQKGWAYGTVAYDAATGAKLWVARYDGPRGSDFAFALGVSRDGSRVFVTGGSDGPSGPDFATVAYDAASGARLWVARYDGGPGDTARALAVSADGSKVFVTGESIGSGGWDYATVAYDAATGAQLWVARYNGPGNGEDHGSALGVSQDGSRLFVTGPSRGSGGDLDFATVAYDATSGAEVWVSRYGSPTGRSDSASSLVVSPDGAKVFVTGESQGVGRDYDYATVAYDAGTGAELWEERYDGSGHGDDYAKAVRVSGDGSTLFVTGGSAGSTSLSDYATVAYDSSTGTRLWGRRYNGTGNGGDVARAVGVSPDGAKVFVTGQSAGSGTSDDYATISYDAATGARLWGKRFSGPADDQDRAMDLAVSPDGSELFVTGYGGKEPDYDYLTVAYSIG